METKCPLCSIVLGTAPHTQVYEDDEAIVVLAGDKEYPQKLHVIPKAHAKFSPTSGAKALPVIQKVSNYCTTHCGYSKVVLSFVEDEHFYVEMLPYVDSRQKLRPVQVIAAEMCQRR